MKKYNTPEIEALALETIDVIATSGDDAAKLALTKAGYDDYAALAKDGGDIADFGTSWSW